MPSVAAFSASQASPLRARPSVPVAASAAPFPPSTFLPPSVRSSSFLCQGLSASVPLLGLSQSRLARSGVFARAATGKSPHDYTVKDIDGMDLDKFKGKILLIVNIASKCGLTQSKYSELTHLYKKYKPQGFEILAFPCNQYGGQEPDSNPEIKNFACTRWMSRDRIPRLYSSS